MVKKYFSKTEEETKKIAMDVASRLQGGEILLLYGDLGTGKTTFVRGLAEALGFDGPVRSPTFTLVNRYPLAHPAIHTLIHTDFYRLENPSELIPLALEEELGSKDTVACIEWPERFPEFVKTFDRVIPVVFEIKGDQRAIEI